MHGYPALNCAIIFQLLTDANSKSMEKAEVLARAEAERWLRRRTAFKDSLLTNAGLNPEVFWLHASKGFPEWTRSMAASRHRATTRRPA